MNTTNNSNNVKNHNKIIKIICIALGSIFVGLGFLGIFLPLLPTTPFLLLAAACYARSSERFYQWLMNNPLFGTYIKNYRENKGIPLRGKMISISLLWITILFSIFMITENIILKYLLFLIAVLVTIHILSFPTLKED